jgi:hypothetical protein
VSLSRVFDFAAEIIVRLSIKSNSKVKVDLSKTKYFIDITQNNA